MKVGMIVPGGVDRSGTHRVIPVLLWLIERLARNHDLHVFALRQEARACSYPLLGATVHNVGARPRRLRALGAIIREHTRAPFDVLHAFWAIPQGVVAAAAGRLLGLPVLLQLIGADLADLPEIGYGALRTRRGRAWLRAAVKGAARVTVPSRPMLQIAYSLGIQADHLPYGVALDRWPTGTPRPKLSYPPRLLQVGSINRVKDQLTLMQALAIVRQRVPAELDLVGVDTLHGVVEAESSRLGLDDAVCFHGFVPHHELRPFFDHADALIVSSRYESGPIAALEAAIAGIPVVGTDVGYLREWAPDAAAISPCGDPRALAATIVGVLENDDRRVSLARNAQRRALAEDADAAADTTHAIYEELVTLRSGRTSEASVSPSFTSLSASPASARIPSDSA